MHNGYEKVLFLMHELTYLPYDISIANKVITLNCLISCLPRKVFVLIFFVNSRKVAVQLFTDIIREVILLFGRDKNCSGRPVDDMTSASVLLVMM